MRKIIVFPGQGYQSMSMLNSEVQDWCRRHGLGDLLDVVLEDNSKIFDTEYAQALIIATQLAQVEKYKSMQNLDTEYVYCGFSLGEITALIASGAIDVKEGLRFARERGKLCKDFSQKNLQEGASPDKPRTFSVAKIAYYYGLEEDIERFNLTRPDYERISITNYIPTNEATSGTFVTITGESETLRNNLQLFGGASNQKTATMQCPFHSEALRDLMPAQINSCDSCITDIDSSCLPQVICTRTALKYHKSHSKSYVNKSLAKYLTQPMQTEKTLLRIKERYRESEIVVTMGQKFAKGFAKQFEVMGGKAEDVIFVEEAIKASTVQSVIVGEIAK